MVSFIDNKVIRGLLNVDSKNVSVKWDFGFGFKSTWTLSRNSNKLFCFVLPKLSNTNMHHLHTFIYGCTVVMYEMNILQRLHTVYISTCLIYLNPFLEIRQTNDNGHPFLPNHPPEVGYRFRLGSCMEVTNSNIIVTSLFKLRSNG